MENPNPGDTVPNKNLNIIPDPNNEDSSLRETIPNRALSAGTGPELIADDLAETAPIKPSSSSVAMPGANPAEDIADFPLAPLSGFEEAQPVGKIGDTAPIKVRRPGDDKRSKPRRWPWIAPP